MPLGWFKLARVITKNELKKLNDFFTNGSENGSLNGAKDKRKNFWPSRDQWRYLPEVLSKNERFLILFFAILAVGSLLVLPFSIFYKYSTVQAYYGGNLVEGMVGIPRHINPILLQDNDVDNDITSVVFNGLMRRGKSGELEPDLAKNLNVSEDGLRYTFELRSGLLWHDSVPVTSDDVVFTINALQNPEFQSPQRVNWQGVEVKKIDESTIVFELKNRYAQFLNNTTVGILPKHVWENIKPGNVRLSDINLRPIGTGPFKVTRIASEKGAVLRLELKAFKEYHLGRPFIEDLEFVFFETEDQMIRAFNRGGIDSMSFVSPSALTAVRGSEKNIYSLSLPRFFAIFLNQSRSEALSDKNVRQALNYATNKEQIVKSILDGHGRVVDSPFLPGILAVPELPLVYPYDPEKAAELLELSEWILREDGFRYDLPPDDDEDTESNKLNIKLVTSDWPELVSAAELIKEQWHAIGVDTEILKTAVVDLQQRIIKDRDYETILFGEVLSPNPDPFSFWHSTQKKDPGLNLALYDNTDVDRLLEQARQTTDFSSRLLKYGEAQELIVDDAPAVFLYSPDYPYVASTAIKGITIGPEGVPSDRFSGIHKWYVNTRRVF